MKPTKQLVFTAALLSLGLFVGIHADAQKKKDAKAKKEPARTTVGAKENSGDGYTRLQSGLEYRIVKHGESTRKPKIGDHVEINILIHDGDSVMFDSRKMNANAPVPLPISAPKFRGDVMEGFVLMSQGDSAIFRIPIDTFKKANMPLPPYAKSGDYLTYNVQLVSVRSEEEEKKEQAEKAEKQKGIDDQLLKEYFAKNNIKAQKTASGLYYSIQKEGTGEKVKAGDNVSVNYTGMFIDGKKFDSNTDPEFKHTTPFELEVGKGHVIKGWDEGLQLLKRGSKAMLYIPSGLAYGPMGRGAQMPANSILIFEVQVLTDQEVKELKENQEKAEKEKNAKQNEIDDKLLQDYFAKNNLKPSKTESGLYYIITTKGLGENAKPGNKVTVNYTGKTLDGKKFDSNTDEAFHHVQPFSFELGRGMVIKGWDEGVQLLKIGSKATLFIPSSLAYGPQGSPPSIGPNAPLIFDVEVTGIDKK